MAKKKVIPPPPPVKRNTLTLRLDKDETYLLGQLQEELGIKAGSRALMEAARIVTGDYQEKKADLKIAISQKLKLEAAISDYMNAYRDKESASENLQKTFRKMQVMLIVSEGSEEDFPEEKNPKSMQIACPMCRNEFDEDEIEAQMCYLCDWIGK